MMPDEIIAARQRSHTKSCLRAVKTVLVGIEDKPRDEQIRRLDAAISHIESLNTIRDILKENSQ